MPTAARSNGITKIRHTTVGTSIRCRVVAFDMNKDGRTVKAAAHFDKNGFFYVYDRTNGQLLSATPFVTKVTWASGVDLKTGRPKFIEDNRPGAPKEGGKGSVVFTAPSFLGGNNWNPPAYSPRYRPVLCRGQRVGDGHLERADQLQEGRRLSGRRLHHRAAVPRLYWRSAGGQSGLRQDRLGAQEPGAVVGRRAGDGRRSLVFTGTPEGYFEAFDAKTGKELWKFQTGSGVVGSPVTWEQDGDEPFSSCAA
jgi:alcohol dehydrogenase (cytochrome c)